MHVILTLDGHYIPLLLWAEPPIVEGLLRDINNENKCLLKFSYYTLNVEIVFVTPFGQQGRNAGAVRRTKVGTHLFCPHQGDLRLL